MVKCNGYRSATPWTSALFVSHLPDLTHHSQTQLQHTYVDMNSSPKKIKSCFLLTFILFQISVAVVFLLWYKEFSVLKNLNKGHSNYN